MARSGIVVVGSANMDMVVTVGQYPHPGETVFGRTFGMFPGGKGANQAVAAAKLGGRVVFIGRMGRDLFGEHLRRSMRGDGVHLDHLVLDPAAPTGMAMIVVNSEGQNEIVVVSGSNMRLSPRDVERRRGVFASTCITLLQLEIPPATVLRAATLARSHQHCVILNPAPAARVPKSLFRHVDYLTPNETETEILTGIRVSGAQSAERGARKLLAMGVRNVVITRGKEGCLLVTPGRVKRFPAMRVKAVDTTAAGDAFNGALAYAIDRHEDLDAAIEFANAVAAYAVTRMGAQRSLPRMADVRKFCRLRRTP